MRRGRLAWLLAAPVLLAACGQSAATRTPSISSVPIVAGGRIVAQTRSCDKGANAYCAWQVVIADPRYASSLDLLASERSALVKRGWSRGGGDTGNEHGADSPGHAARLTYATAFGDLLGIDNGWIKRSWPVTLALSTAVFDRVPALSMLLETGAS